MTTPVDVDLEIRQAIRNFQTEISSHSDNASQAERQLMEYLWGLHKSKVLSVVRIAELLQTSRQTVYNRWEFYEIGG